MDGSCGLLFIFWCCLFSASGYASEANNSTYNQTHYGEEGEIELRHSLRDYDSCMSPERTSCLQQQQDCIYLWGAAHCYDPHHPCRTIGCANKRSCDDDGICDCDSLRGSWCQLPPSCQFLSCENGGVCRLGRCNCLQGWTGYQCERKVCDSLNCKNGALCVLDRCICQENWSGVLCDVRSKIPGPNKPNVCKPDPCLGGCQCQESCKHSYGYICVSAGGFIGKNCTIPVPDLSCQANAIVITIPRRFHAEFDYGHRNSYIYMSPTADGSGSINSQCKAQVNVHGDYVISIGQPFTQCGMVVEMSTLRGSEGDMIFKNELWINKNFAFANYDSPLGIVSIQCTYNTHLSAVTSLVPIVDPPINLVSNTSEYLVSTTLCKVSTCSRECNDMYKLTGSAVYTVGQVIHLDFDVRQTVLHESSDVVATLESASISCSSSPQSGTYQLSLFRNGCPTQYGLDVQAMYGLTSSTRHHHVCMSFRLPRSTRCSQIYIHVDLRVCHGEARSALCDDSGRQTKRCTVMTSKKRSTDSEDRSLVVGPFYLVDRKPGVEKLTFIAADEAVVLRKQTNGSTSHSGLNRAEVIVAVGGAFIFLLATAAAVTVFYLRRSTVKHRTDGVAL